MRINCKLGVISVIGLLSDLTFITSWFKHVLIWLWGSMHSEKVTKVIISPGAAAARGWSQSPVIGRLLARFPWSKWARYWTPNCSWCAGWHLVWQPPPSVYVCMYVWITVSRFGQKCLPNALNVHINIKEWNVQFWFSSQVQVPQNYGLVISHHRGTVTGTSQ